MENIWLTVGWVLSVDFNFIVKLLFLFKQRILILVLCKGKKPLGYHRFIRKEQKNIPMPSILE